MVDVVPLPPPPSSSLPKNNDMWLDEQIWGHRLWDSQSAWLVFLEFLTVAEGCLAEGRLLDPSAAFSVSFRPRKRLYLRNILYNNEVMTDIARRHADNATAWNRWLEWMQNNAQGVPDRDFSYL